MRHVFEYGMDYLSFHYSKVDLSSCSLLVQTKGCGRLEAAAPGGAGQDDVRARGVPDPGGHPAGCVQVGQAQARGRRPVLGELGALAGCSPGSRGPRRHTRLPLGFR